MAPFHIHNIVGKGFWQHASWDPTIFIKNAQDLTPYRFEANCDTNRIRKYFLSLLRFESGSIGGLMGKLVSSVMTLL
jgi:hypothetical protein